MHKIPKFFRKAKTQEGDSVVSPTKQILSPEELEKLKNKIKTEISTAEIRIQYILNKTTRPNERDPKEIENLENDIKNLRAKYAELIDPTVTIYKTKKRAVEQTDQTTSQGPDKPNQPDAATARPRTVTLLDSNDEAEEGATALTTRVEERKTECAKCHTPIVLSITTDKEQCRQCNTHRDTGDAEEQKPKTNQPLKEEQPKENIARVENKEEEVQPQPPRQVHLPPMQHQAQQQQQVARYRAQAGNIFDDDDDDDEMALTNAAVNAWQAAVERQAEILETGLVFINAQSVKKEIPTFTGEIEGKMAIEEWFKLAERMATHAGWTDEQKLHFFQERMSKSAANFNDSLTDDERATYAAWKQAILDGLADNTTKARKKEQLKTLKQEEKERVRDFKTRIDDTYRIAYGVNAATSNHAGVVALRDETKKDVLLNGLKTQISDLVWNRPDIHDATYVETVELAEECEKVVEIKKIAKNKDLSSAVTVMSEEAEKTKEEINNLKGLIQKLMTTPISQPAVQLEEKTINALNRLAISNTDGKWPSQNRERKTVRFASESPNRSRSQTPENRRRYNTPTPYRGDREGSNWGDQKQYESRRCYVCDKKGHLARQCWRAKQSPFAQQNTRQNGQQTYRRNQPGMRTNQPRNRNFNNFRNGTGRNGTN
jgi:hypothetical protein